MLRIQIRSADVGWLTLMAAFMLLCVLWAITSGSYGLSMQRAITVLLFPEQSPERLMTVVWELRLPRVLAAVLSGAALSVAGVVMQTITRNPLASPGLTGVEAGAGVTLLLLMILLPVSLPGYLLPVAAMSGGLVVAMMVYALAVMQGFSPVRLILIGVGMTAFLSAISDLLITYGDIERVESALVWLSGSLHQVVWSDVHTLAWWSLAVIPVWMSFRSLNLLRLGEHVAMTRGVNPRTMMPLLIVLSVSLTSAAVATIGTMSFVGLVGPHIARHFSGDRHGVLIPLAALTGGLMVLIGDTVGRILFAPLQLPGGLVIVMIGAPYFVFLLRRIRH
ncbi:FecCD family ABC transporter permease [Gynuella sp.]|uniref:FecCD family ABC transporter permease n=1 Tax=Gynuella sp. TaxID=2969146 RepID=UPI003D0DADD3